MKSFKDDMMKSALILGLSVGLVSVSDAALFDRGNGLIYDSTQNITWMQDANYAETSGYAAANAVDNGSSSTNNIFANGRMGWDAAVTWADQLEYGGYDDWRLPKTFTDPGTPGCKWAYSGTNCGYNVDTSTSELAYMYDYLGNVSSYDSSGIYKGSSGLQSRSADGITFTNLHYLSFWSGTEYAPLAVNAWNFYIDLGYQDHLSKDNEVYAWAVRSGDVAAPAPVPLPGAVWLFGAGLAGLIRLKRRLG